MSSTRKVDRRTGRTVTESGARGENKRDAKREREIRDVQQAINKGYRNQAIEGFYRK